MLRDLHTHTNYCDGSDTPEAMILSAIEKGLDEIGICTHSYTFFDESYCCKLENYPAFQTELRRLAVKYADKIKVLCGVEQDRYSTAPTDGFDYVIGSVHYVRAGEVYVEVDNSPEYLKNAIAEYYGGDADSFAEAYFAAVAEVAEATGCDLIGHFDLLTKFNEREPIFDTDSEHYVRAYKSAVDKLVQYSVPFEINTGAISRGWRTSPYPSEDISEYILSNGGRLMLSSDSHSAESIAFEFEKYKNYPQK